MTTDKDIPREVAIRLCEEIRAENKRRRFSIGRLQCWGCSLVNKRYRSQKGNK